MENLVLKHADTISKALGIIEIGTKFAPTPISTVAELLFGQLRNYLSEIEMQRIHESIKRILSGLDKDIHEGKKFNPKIVNLSQTDHRQSTTQELLEQIIRKCKDEPERKKQVFISNILRNIVITDNHDPLDPNWGHKITQIAQNLTYQQLILFRWISLWTSHLSLMPFHILSEQEKRLYSQRPNQQEVRRVKGGSNESIIFTNKNPLKYDYLLSYEDYIKLFNEGFRIGPKNQIYDTDKMLIIENYKHLKRIGLIESGDHVQIRRQQDIDFKRRDINEYPCYFIPSQLGSYMLQLLFHEDDFTTIPSLKKDMEEIETIIIDTQIAKELEEKYNKTPK